MQGRALLILAVLGVVFVYPPGGPGPLFQDGGGACVVCPTIIYPDRPQRRQLRLQTKASTISETLSSTFFVAESHPVALLSVARRFISLNTQNLGL